MTRCWIFEHSYGVGSKMVSRILDAKSLLPTHVSYHITFQRSFSSSSFFQSAFSTRLAAFGFNSYTMYVVDILHEFELEVWKALFTHLLQVLYELASDKVGEFNER